MTMTMKTACDTNQTTIASAGGKLRRRSIPAMRNKNPNLLTKIVNKIFSVVFGNRKPSETNEEPQNVHREEGQPASISMPMVTSRPCGYWLLVNGLILPDLDLVDLYH
nr:hypothetical protein [Tanacetum cinerariifolium]